MSDKTGIEWTAGDDGTKGATWNPVTGCDTVSAGCDHCYARTLAARLKAMGNRSYQTDGPAKTSGPGFGVALHPDLLDRPLRWKTPRRIFVNSMSDLFHDDVPDDFIARVFAVMGASPRHVFQVLTKRPRRMQHLLSQRSFWLEVECHWEMLEPIRKLGLRVDEPRLARWPWSHVWLGVSVEDQRWANQRIPLLLRTPAAVRFLSCEPLLGDVLLEPEWLVPKAHLCGYKGNSVESARALADVLRAAGRKLGGGYVDWVIVGGESGSGARKMDLEWARVLVDQCQEFGVPVFVKQLGAAYGTSEDRKAGDQERWPVDLQIRQWPNPLGVAQGTLL